MNKLFITKPDSQQFARHYYNNMDINVMIDTDVLTLKAAMNNADFVWLEWGNDMTANLLNEPYKAKIMVRVHDHEIYRGRIKHINWNWVDCIWFINRQAMKDFKEIMPQVKCKMIFLPNCISDEFAENMVDNHEIAFQSIYARPRKNIERAINVMRELKGTPWKLTVRADPAGFWEYLRPIIDGTEGLNVEFDMRQINLGTYQTEKSDVNEFFKDKSVVISTSKHEGFHYAIAEGMLCGCMPVVYNWEWGQAKDFWKPYVHDSVQEMAEAITKYKPSKEYRKYIEDNFSPEVLVPKLEKEIESLF